LFLSEHGGPGRHLRLSPFGTARVVGFSLSCTHTGENSAYTNAVKHARERVDRHQSSTFHLETGHMCIRIYWHNPDSRPYIHGRTDLHGVSIDAYLTNQHSKHRDYVANYGIRDTIAATTLPIYLSDRSSVVCDDTTNTSRKLHGIAPVH